MHKRFQKIALLMKTTLALLLLLTMLELVASSPAALTGTAARQIVQAAESQTFYSLDELENAISHSLYQRERGLNIRYVGDTNLLEEELPLILERLLQNDDYLRYSMRGWRWRWSGVPGDIKIDLLFDHLTTPEEDTFVREEVTRIMNRILTAEMDEHQKIKAIHDYVVASVAYDGSYEGYTAYDALAKGKAVCQGYALLTYKMLTNAGLETRIISGSAGGENHAWNLVRLDGNWYHLDTTWNSPAPNVPGRVLYPYYNRTDDVMLATHTWQREDYPAATTPYRTPAGMQLNAAIITAYAGESLPAQPGQPADKMWTIRFNQRIMPATVNNQNIFVADRRGNLHPVRVHAGDDGRSVIIVPEQNYPAGETLYLLVGRDILSLTGNQMEGPAWMEFSVQ